MLALDDLGLAGALEQLLHEEKARAEWDEVEFRHNIAERRYDESLQTAIYRVAQEALTNARKYARTRKVMISLLTVTAAHAGQSQLVLEVRDWGQGFAVEEKLRENGRVGLHSMSERVLLWGGAYRLQSAPGEGTYIRAEFPALEPQ
jgi:two-component system sensor histidine kinase NreB